MIVTEREAETQAQGEEAGPMHREPDMGFDPGSPGSRPGPKAGAKPLCHPGIPGGCILNCDFMRCHSHDTRIAKSQTITDVPFQ